MNHHCIAHKIGDNSKQCAKREGGSWPGSDLLPHPLPPIPPLIIRIIIIVIIIILYYHYHYVLHLPPTPPLVIHVIIMIFVIIWSSSLSLYPSAPLPPVPPLIIRIIIIVIITPIRTLRFFATKQWKQRKQFCVVVLHSSLKVFLFSL